MSEDNIIEVQAEEVSVETPIEVSVEVPSEISEVSADAPVEPEAI